LRLRGGGKTISGYKYKGITSKEYLFKVLDYLEELKIRYWVDCDWGVVILTGKQNRDHRDIDFDAEYEEVLLKELIGKGYKITTD